MFARNYNGAVQFSVTPSNSYSVVLRRVMEFVDYDDNENINEKTIFSYWLNTSDKYTMSYKESTSVFQILINEINGTLQIEVVYEGTKMRDTKFSKLYVTPTSYFLNIELQTTKLNSSKSRFAFELLIMGFNMNRPRISTLRYMDDQYTPGTSIFSYNDYYCPK
ncbi:unnamed protein product [Didymodactylos carnosus]|uniref:Uncharacterized protein n=1 Tax=Didymodactylos carnosus TaxID=1234261 RepID=A0A814UW68_9BILA|nr:unnamed protein product [Didymodactylos carnosus]CAF3944413.1 unnamed protein product [Didymodactylos carnosus]